MDNEKKEYDELQEETYAVCKKYIIKAKNKICVSINSTMVDTYWKIGKVLYESCSFKGKAKYGDRLLENVSEKLTFEFGKGYSIRNLRNMRTFYMKYPNRQTVSSELSWSHYCLLMKINNKDRRDFYTNESISSSWSVRQLERQINTFYYDRSLQRNDNKRPTHELSISKTEIEYKTILKDPYVMEFLDLPKNEHLYETELEQNLINHLHDFLLELGKGYSFVSRQKHFQVDGEHFYIDLLFYNYILKCFVIIDLKTNKLTHQDLGQMQMYVNYYTREMMNDGDNPPIGIILCTDKSDTLIRYTLPEDNKQIYAAKYIPYLPSEDELIEELQLYKKGSHQ